MPKIWQKNEKNFLRNISSWYFQNLNSKYHQVSDNRSVTNLYTQFKSAICTRYIGMLRLPFTFEGYSLEIRVFRSTKCYTKKFQNLQYLICIRKLNCTFLPYGNPIIRWKHKYSGNEKQIQVFFAIHTQNIQILTFFSRTFC